MITLTLANTRYTTVADRLETVFKVLFFLYGALTFNCITFGTIAISVVMWPTFALGALLLLYRAVTWRRFHTPYMWALVILLTAGCVSVLLNYRYNLKMNILYMICWAFYFLILYVQPHERVMAALKRELHLFATLYTIFTEVCVVVSIVMLFSGYSLHVEFEGGRLLGGFVDSRLYGMFIDPNAGATCAAVAGLFLGHALRLYRCWWQRTLLLLGGALNLFYIALSDSRTGMVVLFVLGLIYTLLYLLRRLQHLRLAPLLAVAGAVIIGIGGLCAPTLVKTMYNRGVALFATNMSGGTQTDSDNTTDDKRQEIIDSLTVHRDYDLSGDISNRRFSVWRSGLEIFATRPLFGTSYGGFTDYAKEALPNTYIVNNDHVDMITFDNEIVNVLVSTGIAGTLPLLIFAVGILLFILRHFNRMGDGLYPLLSTSLAAVFGIAASAMFRTAMFYYISPNANLFWTLLGIIATVCALNAKPTKQGEYDET